MGGEGVVGGHRSRLHAAARWKAERANHHCSMQ